MTQAAYTDRRSLICSGTLIGIGMGGFIDGILFHQLLQLHHMLSSKLPVKDVDITKIAVNLEINMFWDGVFHLFTWLITAAGIAMLWNMSLLRNIVAMNKQIAPKLQEEAKSLPEVNVIYKHEVFFTKTNIPFQTKYESEKPFWHYSPFKKGTANNYEYVMLSYQPQNEWHALIRYAEGWTDSFNDFVAFVTQSDVHRKWLSAIEMAVPLMKRKREIEKYFVTMAGIDEFEAMIKKIEKKPPGWK